MKKSNVTKLKKKDPNIWKIDGEAFIRIRNIIKKDVRIFEEKQRKIDTLKEEIETQKKLFWDEIFKEIGTSRNEIANKSNYEFDDELESEGIYIIRKDESKSMHDLMKILMSTND